MTELQHQIIIFRWAKQYNGNNYQWLELLHSSNNGMLSTAKHINIAKQSGLIVGIPDICLPVANPHYNSLWIELKKVKGVITNEQLEIIQKLNNHGNYACIAYGAGQAIEKIIAYLDNQL